MMKFFILVVTWWTVASSTTFIDSYHQHDPRSIDTTPQFIYINGSLNQLDPFVKNEKFPATPESILDSNSTFNASALIQPTDDKNGSSVIATAEEAPSRKRNLPTGPINLKPRYPSSIPRVPYKNPWNTYPDQGAPDYSPIYQGDSKYDLSKIHLTYLNSKPYGGCKKQHSRSTPINMKPFVSEVRLHLINQKIKEKDAYIKGHYIPARKPTADGRHQLTGILPTENEKFFEQENALFLEGLTIKYQNKLCLPPSEVASYLPSIRVPPELKVPCSTKHNINGGHGTPCRDSKYRTIDGSCNNLRYPFWGKSNVCHIRLLPAAYEDGVSKPRKTSYTGRNPLREPRDISINMLQDRTSSGSFYNSWHTLWGQYIVHDMTSTPQATADHDELIKCCPDKSKGQSDYDPAKCMPIFLSSNDVQANVRKCINFIRAAPCPLCTLGQRQQMNLATSFLDQSLMYGNDMDTLNGLRAHHDGLLKVKHHEKGDLLPDPDDPATDQCSHPEKLNHICFKSGDIRVNQHPPMQLLHTLWVRRHNHHAKGLAEANPSWRRNDEILFQEARRITIAEHQHITYREYLPILLGPELMEYYGLDVTKSLYCNYDPYVNPTTINEFVTAAGRFGHSQVGNMFPQSMNISLKDNFFNPEAMRAGHCDFITAGLLQQSSNVVDPHFSTALKNHLYAHRDKLKGFGGDLPTFNINRGRDHGIPPYFVFLKFCFNYDAKNWNDLRNFIEPEALKKMTTIYADFRDIDLYVGGISERKQPDADLGPTFACLLGLQFRALKYGDRYFYSHGGQTGSFTPSQLKDMKTKFSLANFLCLTSKNLQSVPKFAFLSPSKYNPIIPCEYYRKNGWVDHKLFA